MEHISSIMEELFRKHPITDQQRNSQNEFGGKNVGTKVLGETSVSVKTLYYKYTPSYSNRYKESVWRNVKDAYGQSMANGFMGNIGIKRVCLESCEDCTAELSYTTEIVQVSYFFDYQSSDTEAKRWYLNFADPTLFVACNGSLFAQDEIQTLEHPLLCAVRDYLGMNRIEGLELFTHDGRKSTPYLFTNVPYLVNVNTCPTLPNGSIVSVYGNAFSYYEYRNPEVLDYAIKVRNEYSSSNIIAMAAPRPSYGCYEKETILDMLGNVIAAFDGAKSMSERKNIEIHTGRWGAGAFGGNEELALIVQILGARIAKTDKLVFHAVNDNCLRNAIAEVSNLNTLFSERTIKSVKHIADYLYEKKYQWGVSDGN